ncbi:hypothetical protein VOLCADRAFT_121526 [Volvox carteri f. nagariensis]|uniref:Sulfotransferase domain-containing protein n=1 Tax=Volvox carteri f. nagariensis TaxID=3068 RepID=D8UCP1_VOLCA|nr:uncharacterized protein VOLCADRAFT_121526 [Volvox carteri f. nagariensis]EFJ42585.1 hypothetical protein VOLCADRAFT_121526 [Volvox carteri f. nagariensis]|eukprot:XP_002956441.1 hypothetical protein VOLCADRAFT_121526 [Volvox carteri f. nagariensis]
MGTNLVYFLHVPRTAGRTFQSCLLRMGVHPALRCPKAYDHLRITNMSQPNCYLLSSHDDFSVVSMLPPDVAVITQLRDPVDRFLSAYEFAVEVASRTLRRPKNFRKRVGRIATEDVWPWSYLVPFFAEDLKAKVPAAQAKVLPPGGVWAEMEDGDRRYFFNKATNETRDALTEAEAAQGMLPLLDPYDNELVLSLKDFANHPIASELLHNGASFQVLGITNYSHWGDAGGFRACLLRYEHLRDRLLEVAKKRVQRFTHVGTTDRLYESAASALVSLGFTVDSPAYSGGDEDVAGRGGTRRRAAEAAMAKAKAAAGGDGSGNGWVPAAGQPVNGEAAARLQLLAKLVREARRRLQNAQIELVNAQKSNSDPGLVAMLRNRVDSARNELIDAQENLASVREMLPADLGGAGGSQQQQQQQEFDLDDSAVASQAARRRRLLQDDTASSASSASSTSQQHQEDGGSVGDLDSAQAEDRAGQMRKLISRVTFPKVDAFGYELDPKYKEIRNSNVGMEFVRCANAAQERSTSRRGQSLSVLSTADGRKVVFSKAARKRIPKEVIDLIRSYNTMDTPLHQLGLSLLDKRIAEQKADQLYEDLPQAQARRSHPRQDTQVKADKSSGGDELR